MTYDICIYKAGVWKCSSHPGILPLLTDLLYIGLCTNRKSMSVPPGAILGGLTILTSFVISPTVVTVPNTDWEEATLLWLTIRMPTGSRKSTVYQFLGKLLHDIRIKAGCKGMLMYNFITVKQMCMFATPHVLQLLLYNHISCAYTLDSDPIWLFQDSTFEKMGMHMADNGGRLVAASRAQTKQGYAKYLGCQQVITEINRIRWKEIKNRN